MKENLKDYAKIGLVYHMLYPDCAEDPQYHVKTLNEFINIYNIETFDTIMPFGRLYRKQLEPVLKKCGKEIVFNNHISLLKKIDISSCSYVDNEIAMLIIKDQIKAAKSIGAKGYLFTSGSNVEKKQRKATIKKFKDFCRWFCGRISKYGIVAMIEPFDTDVDKKFLIGPTEECSELILSLGIDNLGIELDFAHVPLLRESFYDAVKNTHKFLKRVHLGNCVLKNPGSKWYGDKHPPLGIEDGEIGTEEVAEIMSALLKFGYLNKKTRNPLVLEIRPFDNMSQEESVADNFEKLEQAWRMI